MTRRNSSPATSKGLRILERDKYRCAYCGDHAGYIDHIIPVSKGGTSDDGNLVAACFSCNAKKSNKIEMDMISRAFFVVATNSGGGEMPVRNASEGPQEAPGDDEPPTAKKSRIRRPQFHVPSRCWLGMASCIHTRYTYDLATAELWLEEFRSGKPREAVA